MIVVVEGASTAGKSTWCSKFPQHLVLETGRLSGIPNRNADPDGAAQFWARQNAARWHEALTREQSSGVAICDTDPLKLHHVWTLWQTGQVQKQDWSRELNATRKLIQEKKILFADLYLIKKVDPVEARRRRGRRFIQNTPQF